MKTVCRRFVVCVLVIFGVAILAGCARGPLASWNENAPAKVALVEYVTRVTDKSSPDFIPVEDRIAVFDFDGTLFLETDPTYFDWMLFARDDWKTIYGPGVTRKGTGK